MLAIVSVVAALFRLLFFGQVQGQAWVSVWCYSSSKQASANHALTSYCSIVPSTELVAAVVAQVGTFALSG